MLNDIYRCDLQTSKWVHVEAYGTLPPPMYGMVITIYQHYLLVQGGFDRQGNNNKVFALDLHLHQWQVWSCKGDVPPGKEGHFAVLQGDRWIFFCGRKHNWQSTNDVHVLHLPTRTWTLQACTGAVPCARTDVAAVLVPNRNLLLVFGGYDDRGQFLGRHNDLFALDLQTWVWQDWSAQQSGTIPVELSAHRAVLVHVQKVPHMFVFGGWDTYKIDRPEAYLLNLQTLEWKLVTAKGPAASARRYMCILNGAVKYHGQESILLHGGFNDYEGYYNDLKVLQTCAFTNNMESVTLPNYTVLGSWLQSAKEHAHVLHKILLYATGSELFACSQVGKQWHHLVTSNHDLWINNVHKIWKYNSKDWNTIPTMMQAFLFDHGKLSGMLTLNKIRPKLQYIQLCQAYSYCKHESNDYWHSIEKITQFVSLLQIVGEREYTMLQPWKFYIAVYSTPLIETPLVKVLVALHPKRSTHLVSLLHVHLLGSLLQEHQKWFFASLLHGVALDELELLSLSRYLIALLRALDNQLSYGAVCVTKESATSVRISLELRHFKSKFCSLHIQFKQHLSNSLFEFAAAFIEYAGMK